MPSLRHETLVELFRARAELAPTLLRLCTGIELAGTRVELGPADLSQVTPTEYRADATVVLRDDVGKPTSAVIVEVQLQSDADKRLVWPLYVAALRARLDSPVLLLVIAPDPSVATWARKRIDLGHPGFCLQPLVIDDAAIPYIDDPLAHHMPELAVVASLAHPDVASARLALAAIRDLPEDRRELYWDTLIDALPDEVLAALENPMPYEYQSKFVRENFAKGRAEGQRDTLVNLAVQLLRDKVGAVDPATEDLIRSQATDVLNRLARELGNARDANEARVAIDRLGT